MRVTCSICGTYLGKRPPFDNDNKMQMPCKKCLKIEMDKVKAIERKQNKHN